MAGRPWSRNDKQKVLNSLKAGVSRRAIAASVNRTYAAINDIIKREGWIGLQPIEESPYPSYSEPLVWEGDALILPDTEFPFHHAEWINRCVRLAHIWDIDHLVIAGDMLHLGALSRFDPPWIEDDDDGGNEGLTREMRVAHQQLSKLVSEFDTTDLVMGNHEGRFLRAIGSAVSPELLLKLIALDKRIRTAPYYFMTIHSAGVPFLVEHPRTTAKYSPGYLADKYEANVLMAHSHKVGMSASRSGKWYGWHIGCCVDESKLQYASQRHNAGDAHKLGAAIVRNGVACPLFEGWVDWDWLERAGR